MHPGHKIPIWYALDVLFPSSCFSYSPRARESARLTSRPTAGPVSLFASREAAVELRPCISPSPSFSPHRPPRGSPATSRVPADCKAAQGCTGWDREVCFASFFLAPRGGLHPARICHFGIASTYLGNNGCRHGKRLLRHAPRCASSQDVPCGFSRRTSKCVPLGMLARSQGAYTAQATSCVRAIF
ncbi:hypothetical protein BD626DRAFT_272666 [Schizophyllum amplum]|uniref:Uncharacterized protein n=1 Tax=Schizophyllum amplum TaxID=97359 RepID=A0A550CFC6_9AGAR|nr:hypothetical protein BD626DRAFT_272666 [Auriculariopsis ampla]